MTRTPERLLALLSLLQTRREWPGSELAERLEVTTRTVRRDVDRLRELGYPVNATPGAAGYQLGAGAELPPLLLDDEEAVAVAVGLRSAAGGTIEGIEESSTRALAKLEQVLPSRLRHRVSSMRAMTVPVPSGGAAVAPDTLQELVRVCATSERLRFDYTGHDGGSSVRTVEPHRLVSAGRRWYLVAWDLDRDDWRTFRVDRLRPRIPTGPRFTPRTPPDDLGAFISRAMSIAPYRYRARFTLHVSAEAAAEAVPPSVGTIEAIGPDRCTLNTGSNSLDELTLYVGLFGFDFDTHEPPELIEHIRDLTTRLGRSVGRDDAE